VPVYFFSHRLVISSAYNPGDVQVRLPVGAFSRWPLLLWSGYRNPTPPGENTLWSCLFESAIIPSIRESLKVKKSLSLLAFAAGLCYPTPDVALRYEVSQILPLFIFNIASKEALHIPG
jgi:hypothetical protein